MQADESLNQRESSDTNSAGSAHQLNFFNEPTPQPPLPSHLTLATAILDSLITTVVVILLTIYSLYGDYLRLILLGKSSIAFDILTGLALLVMSAQFVLQVICRDRYLHSFYFYYDLTFPILLVFDFNFLQQAIYARLDS